MSEDIDGAAIEAACKRRHEHVRTLLDAAGHDIAKCRLQVAAFPANGGPGIVEHFEIGDHDGEAKHIATTPRGMNVYWPLVVMPADIVKGKRGTTDDVIGVYGVACDIDADKGNGFRVEDLPVHPTYSLRTSRTQVGDKLVENFQAAYLMTRLLSVADAEPLTQALTHICGDADGGHAVFHLWRIPGTLSWPKRIKIEKRGRSTAPQLVVLIGGDHG